MKLLKFEADWCQPCKLQTKIMAGLDYEAIDIDTKDGAALAVHHGVRSIPTIILLNEDGEALQTAVGVTPRQKLEAWLE